MEQAAREKGYSLILFNSDYDREKEKHCLEVMRRYRVDGLIIVPVLEQDPKFRAEIKELDIPAVSITRQTEHMDCVYIDHALQEPGWLNICGISAARIICLWELPGTGSIRALRKR